ncbi:hypothetical protein EDD86DRAFT_192660 [Gorgonomyces haynaldii]|nr:hypothetical protein EDD86DRAFT_192660 [Gorgonomyces haynaldii]
MGRENWFKTTVFNVLSYKLCRESPDLYTKLFNTQEQSDGYTGKPCGKMFHKGDAVYRCKTCGLDPTVVMCSSCFKGSKHEGHDVTFSYGSGSGGYCDCGDPEAWKIPLQCIYHTPRDDAKALELELEDSEREHLNRFFFTLFYTVYLILNNAPSDFEASKTDSNVPNLPLSPQYTALLWNDESHSFNEVIDQVQLATGCNAQDAQNVATIVDAKGRTSIGMSQSVNALVSIARVIERIGLVTSIQPSDNVFREDLCCFLIKWLVELPNQVCLSAQAVMRDLIVNALLSQIPDTQDYFLDVFLSFDPKLWKDCRNVLRALYVESTVHGTEEQKKMIGQRFSSSYMSIARGCIFADREKDISIINFAVQLFTVPSVAEYLIDETNIIETMISMLKALSLMSDNEIDPSRQFFQRVEQARQDQSNYYHKLETISSKHMYYFFHDMRMLLLAYRNRTHDKYPLKEERSELKRFLNLLLVWQDTHPQVRLVQTHVEYESDNWVHAFNHHIQVEKLLQFIACSYWPSQSIQHAPWLLDCTSQVRDALLVWTVQDHQYMIKQTINPQNESGFHDFEFVPGLPLRIPDFRVLSQPVSFHKPLHRFFGHLLTFFPKLLHVDANNQFGDKLLDFLCPPKESPTSDLSAEHWYMLLFDHTIRTFAFSAQIKADLWVRNGASMRAQQSHYKELALRSASDIDLYLLQIGVITLGPDVLLSLLLDRFDLTNWFSLEAQAQSYDPQQTNVMLQELLQIVIVLGTERAILSSMSHHNRLKREIVHHLAVSRSGLPYSELNKRISDNGDEDDEEEEEYGVSFDDVLKSVSTFKFPDGTTDHGVYMLKEQFYDQVYPWFYHYNRNQREELEDILKERDLKREKLGDDQFKSRVPQIPLHQILDKINGLYSSPTFYRLLFFGLFNQTRTKDNAFEAKSNDMILGQLIHLIVLGLELDHESFTKRALEKFSIPVYDTMRETSLLEWVLGLVDRAGEESLKDNAKQLRYCVNLFMNAGGECVSIINGWRDKSNWTLTKISQPMLVDDSSMTEKERKKAAAKARQQAIMQQFQQAQSSFMANFGEDVEDEIMETVEVKEEAEQEIAHERKWEFPTGSCIVCQEELNSAGELYGMLCLLQHSSIRKTVDFSDPYSIRMSQSSGDLDQEQELKHESVWGQEEHFFGTKNKIPGCFASSCGHLMHVKCFEDYQKSIRTRHQSQPTRNHPETLRYKEFMCPLCKSLGNALLPQLWSSRQEHINWMGTKTHFNTMELLDLESYHKEIDQMAKSEYPVLQENIFARFVERIATPHASVALQSLGSFSSLPGQFDQGSIPLGHVKHMYSKYVAPNLRRLSTTDASVFEQTQMLWDCFRSTICITELSSRGASQIWAPGLPLSPMANDLQRIGIYDRITQTNLTTLNVLSELCKTQLLLEGNMTESKMSKTVTQFLNVVSGVDPQLVQNKRPLLLDDGLVHLVFCTMTVFPSYSLDNRHIFNWIHLLATSEILRSLVGVVEGMLLYPQHFASDKQDPVDSKIGFILKKICTGLVIPYVRIKPLIAQSMDMITRIVSSNLLIFLRRACLLLYSAFGWVPPGGALGFGFDLSKSGDSILDETSEFERLRQYLNLPDIQVLFEELLTGTNSLKSNWWINHLKLDQSNHFDQLLSGFMKKPLIEIEYPHLYDLIPLPHALESLLESSVKRKCRKCNQVPGDPAICLICGDLVCSQSFCCGEEHRGECNIHMSQCGGFVGLYFVIKKCAVLVLSNQLGYFLNPPYLDIHGEVDLGLRRGKPQFLNDKRYQVLKKLWIQHNIPSFVARKMEQTYDLGGWPTL